MANDLTIPEVGSKTTWALYSEYLKHQYRLLRRLGRSGHPVLTSLATFAGRVAETDPGALFAALKRPTVGGPLRCLAQARGAEVHTLAALLATQLAHELASSGVPVTLGPVSAPPSTLIALGNGTVSEFGAADPLEWTDGKCSHTPERVLTDRLPPIREWLRLALVDNNPRADLEAHPDKSGNRVDLGGHPASEWVDAMDAALTLVETHLPAIADEMRVVAQQLVPVGYDAEKHLSASYQEIVGNIYLTLHPDPLTLAEALVHEFSHNKLNMLFSLDPVLHNAFSPLYTSPVRPDPRPLHGILLAVHAFLPVEAMYRHMAAVDAPLVAHPRFSARRKRVRQNNQAATDVLVAHAEPTNRGRPLLEEIVRLNADFAS